MNRKQIIVLWIGVIIFALRAFFPPISYPSLAEIMSSSPGRNGIDIPLLVSHELGILVLTVAACFTLKDKR